jgi:hypothetical protein
VNKGIDLLVALGAGDIKHPGGTLLTHLTRVADHLKEWGASEDVQNAGLLHAVFAPDGSPDPMFSMLPLDERDKVVAAAGPESAALVYIYGAMDRQYTYPRLTDTADQWKDRFTGQIRTLGEVEMRSLMEITAANEVDICGHNAAFREANHVELLELFTRTRHLISAKAWNRIQEVMA